MTERSIALFDIDNTLLNVGEPQSPGFSVLSFADFLVSKNKFHIDARIKMDQDLADLRNKRTNYGQFASAVVDHYSEGLRGFSVQEISIAGRAFVPIYRQALFDFTEKLVTRMNQLGETVVISGAPRQAFLPLGKFLGIRRVFLLEAKSQNGRFIGDTKVNMALDQEKEKIISKLIKSRFNPTLSFAFGDSMHDLPLLNAVSNAFVILESNRDEELEKIALARNWPIVDSRSIMEKVNQAIRNLPIV